MGEEGGMYGEEGKFTDGLGEETLRGKEPNVQEKDVEKEVLTFVLKK